MSFDSIEKDKLGKIWPWNHKTLSEDFVREFKGKVDWTIIDKNQKPLDEYQNKIKAIYKANQHPTNTMSSALFEEKKRYIKEQDKAGFKVGDKVKILRKAKNWENGWLNIWTHGMDRNVGKTGTIKRINRTDGIFIRIDNSSQVINYPYPYFILEKVNKDTTTKTDEPKSKDEWNSKCPICNSDSYFGFTSLECSNPSCTNFKKG